MSNSHTGHGHGLGGLGAGGVAGGGAAAGGGAVAGGDHINRHFGEGAPVSDVQLVVFSSPTEHVEHLAWWQAVPMGGGWTINVIVLIAILCVLVIGVSALIRGVVTRCSK